jgi:uncharacterized protein (TIGR00251 family)
MADPHALDVRAAPGGVTLAVWAKPRASKSRVLGVRGRSLEVALAAPPVDGAANDELRRVLARHFDVPRRDVSIEAGAASREKRVAIRGIGVADILAKIPRAD